MPFDHRLSELAGSLGDRLLYKGHQFEQVSKVIQVIRGTSTPQLYSHYTRLPPEPIYTKYRES